MYRHVYGHVHRHAYRHVYRHVYTHMCIGHVHRLGWMPSDISKHWHDCAHGIALHTPIVYTHSYQHVCTWHVYTHGIVVCRSIEMPTHMPVHISIHTSILMRIHSIGMHVLYTCLYALLCTCVDPYGLHE